MPVLGWSIDASSIEDGPGSWNQMETFRMELGFQRLGNTPGPALLSLSNPSGEFFRATRRDEEIWRIAILDWDHPAMKALIAAAGGTLKNENVSLSRTDPDELFNLIMPGLLPERLRPIPIDRIWLIQVALPQAFRGLFDAFRSAMMSTLGSLTHVPPLRSLPERGFDPLRASVVWQNLARDPDTLAQLNKWLGKRESFKSPVKLEVIRYLREDVVQREMPSIVRQNVIQWLGKATAEGVDDTLIAARDRWNNLPNRSYFAKQCPEFWEKLVAKEMDYFSDNHVDQGIEDWESLSDEEKRSHAEQLVEDIFGNEIDYAEDETEPFLKFLEQDSEMLEFVSTHLDESKASLNLLQQSTDTSLKSRAAMLLRDLTSETLISFQDVGVGISQVIPVVANAISLRNSLIAIEQPEIHIHPALQAELGDVFIESALGENKNTFLLETHSEHLILRILRRIRETTRNKLPDGCHPVTLDDVAVLYVEPGKEGSIVHELRINEQGRFVDEWPSGFFEGRLEELS
ncbi:MAG: hypothetical protein CFE26_08810 [Verrucomicrobiales bacterium VVV1]|nr:MAG: hypothetical protein CFE26_08810 [Verrucomicrobiales bacterium VVV1]